MEECRGGNGGEKKGGMRKKSGSGRKRCEGVFVCVDGVCACIYQPRNTIFCYCFSRPLVFMENLLIMKLNFIPQSLGGGGMKKKEKNRPHQVYLSV